MTPPSFHERNRPASQSLVRRLLAVGLTTGVVVSSLIAGAAAAQAADAAPNPAWEIKDASGEPARLIFSEPSGSNLPQAAFAGTDTVSVEAGAPPSPTGDYNAYGSYLIDAAGNQTWFVANSADSGHPIPGRAGHDIMLGEKWSRIGALGSGLLDYRNAMGEAALPNLPTGEYRVVLAVFLGHGFAQPVPAKLTDATEYRYWQYGLKWTKGATEEETSWRWVPVSELGGGTSETATTTTLEATGTTTTSTTLTAKVAPAGATGKVQYKLKGGANLGEPLDVTAGQAASYAVSGLTPGQSYTYEAVFTGSGNFGDSTGETTVQTPSAPPADTSNSDVTVQVPTEGGWTPSLKITSKPASTLPLTGTELRVDGQAWTASGQLGEVTVTDDRRDATKDAWNLSGSATTFIKAGTADEILASNFGWTPELVGSVGTAGPAASDLSTAQRLARGDASNEKNVSTTVKAGLSLNVPSGKPAGDYKGTLTLTLI